MPRATLLLVLSISLIGLIRPTAAEDTAAAATTATTATPALLEATQSENLERVSALLKQGANPNSPNRYGVTPLANACQSGNAALIEALLKAGAESETALPGGETPLMTAARTGRVGPVELLLKHGASVDKKNGARQSALSFAAAEGHAAVVAALLDAEADPNQKTKRGFTPMMFAARAGHAEVVETLLQAKADVNAAVPTSKGRKPTTGSLDGVTALRLAVENAHYDLALRLVRAGADANDSSSAFSPLHVLTWVRKPHRGEGKDGLPPPKGSGELTSLAFARALIEEGKATVDAKVKGGGFANQTAFLMAARRADLEFMKLLHELGADPFAVEGSGTTALLSASGIGSRTPEEEAGSETERIAVLAWLLELGADVNQLNKHGESTMHGAAFKNAPEMIDWLMEKGAKVTVWNEKNRNGWTPLLIARGYRPGNFKPSFETEAALIRVMEKAGVAVPPPPVRLPAGTDKNAKKGYRP